jgi:hypothetical protein
MKHTVKYFILCALAIGVLPIWAQTKADEMDVSPKDNPVIATPEVSGYVFYIGDIYFSEQIPLTTLVGLTETVELRCLYNGISYPVKEFTMTAFINDEEGVIWVDCKNKISTSFFKYLQASSFLQIEKVKVDIDGEVKDSPGVSAKII